MMEGKNPRICTVLGGRSFVGRSLVSKLLSSDDWIVRVADSDPSLDFDLSEQSSILSRAILSNRASYIHVDLRHQSQIRGAIEGSSVVFHTDCLDFTLRDFYHHYMTIVQGAKNVIRACQDCKVERLIYNSSADVVVDGIQAIHNGNESLPYSWRFKDMLTDLKAQAEALVLFANGSHGLLTCALRPSNVFGPGDKQSVPFIVGQAKSWSAKVIIGDGENMCDFTYVENVAHAHICAENSLRSGIASVAGKAFFITNLEPMKMWDFVSLILEGLGYPRPQFHLPTRLVLFIAVLIDWMFQRLGSRKIAYPRLSPAMVHLLSCTKTFDCSNAQKQIGYSPIVSLKEGVALTIESFSHLAEGSAYTGDKDYNQPTKVDKLLGFGRVADILLWRDEKKTFACFLTLVFLFYWFFYSGRTLISSMAKLLLLFSVLLYGQSLLPSSIFGFTVEKISSTYFELSEKVLEDTVIFLSTAWNKQVVGTLRALARGDDWNVFFKVASHLYFLKLLLSFSFRVIFGVGLVCIFTVFIVYDQYEEEIDNIMAGFYVSLKKLKALVINRQFYSHE